MKRRVVAAAQAVEIWGPFAIGALGLVMYRLMDGLT